MTNPHICTVGDCQPGADGNQRRVGGWVAAIQLEGGPVGWRKARRSVGNGNCVEVSSLKGNVLVRDSMIPDSPVVGFPASAWQLFLDATKAR